MIPHLLAKYMSGSLFAIGGSKESTNVEKTWGELEKIDPARGWQRGDEMMLLLDCESRTLAAARNGVSLGVILRDLPTDLYWCLKCNWPRDVTRRRINGTAQTKLSSYKANASHKLLGL